MWGGTSASTSPHNPPPPTTRAASLRALASAADRPAHPTRARDGWKVGRALGILHSLRVCELTHCTLSEPSLYMMRQRQDFYPRTLGFRGAALWRIGAALGKSWGHLEQTGGFCRGVVSLWPIFYWTRTLSAVASSSKLPRGLRWAAMRG